MHMRGVEPRMLIQQTVCNLQEAKSERQPLASMPKAQSKAPPLPLPLSSPSFSSSWNLVLTWAVPVSGEMGQRRQRCGQRGEVGEGKIWSQSRKPRGKAGRIDRRSVGRNRGGRAEGCGGMWGRTCGHCPSFEHACFLSLKEGWQRQ